MNNIEIRDVEVGRVPGLGIVSVDMRLTWVPQKATTMNHEQVHGYWAFATSGSVLKRRNSWDYYMAGQIIDQVALVGTPLVKRLVKVWQEWHLNDMRAGCVHQGEPKEFGDIDSVPACSETGYRYGHAWLVKVMPDEVLAEVRAIAAELLHIG